MKGLVGLLVRRPPGRLHLFRQMEPARACPGQRRPPAGRVLARRRANGLPIRAGHAQCPELPAAMNVPPGLIEKSSTRSTARGRPAVRWVRELGR
jgi:hypothetical protein